MGSVGIGRSLCEFLKRGERELLGRESKIIQVFRIVGVSLRQAKKDVSRLSQIALFEERSAFPVLGGSTRSGSIQQLQHAVGIMLRSEERRVGKECRSRW